MAKLKVDTTTYLAEVEQELTISINHNQKLGDIINSIEKQEHAQLWLSKKRKQLGRLESAAIKQLTKANMENHFSDGGYEVAKEACHIIFRKFKNQIEERYKEAIQSQLEPAYT